MHDIVEPRPHMALDETPIGAALANLAQSGKPAPVVDEEKFVAEVTVHEMAPIVDEPFAPKYAQLKKDMLAGAEAVAGCYENLAKRYMDMAAKVRAQGASAAAQHIDDQIALDQAEEAIQRHFKRVNSDASQTPGRSVAPAN